MILRALIMKGRYFTPADTASSRLVALVGSSLANRYWNGGDAGGRRIRLTDPGTEAPWIPIVGIVGDVRNDDADALPLPTIYFPLPQRPARTLTYVIQTSEDTGTATAAIRDAVWSVESGLPLYRFRTMRQVLWDDLAGSYLTVALMGVFGVIVLSLAALGIFGVLSNVTTERSGELAIRTALGAKPGTIVRQFVWKGLRLAIGGVTIASIAGVSVARTMRSALYGVGLADPIAFGVATSVLLFIATLACYIPARRASRTDPMIVLRSE